MDSYLGDGTGTLDTTTKTSWDGSWTSEMIILLLFLLLLVPFHSRKSFFGGLGRHTWVVDGMFDWYGFLGTHWSRERDYILKPLHWWSPDTLKVKTSGQKNKSSFAPCPNKSTATTSCIRSFPFSPPTSPGELQPRWLLCDTSGLPTLPYADRLNNPRFLLNCRTVTAKAFITPGDDRSICQNCSKGPI